MEWRTILRAASFFARWTGSRRSASPRSDVRAFVAGCCFSVLAVLFLTNFQIEPAAAATCTGSLQAEVDAAPPGSTVVASPCVYREQLTITRPVTIQGQPGSEVRGSDPWTDWVYSDGYWRSAKTLPDFPQTPVECNPDTRRCLWPEQVFLDGEPLEQVASNPQSGEFSVDSGRSVVLKDDPTDRLVEVSVRRHWVLGTTSDVTIEGFTMKHAANEGRSGAIMNRVSRLDKGYANWTVQDNRLSDAHGGVVSLKGASGLKVLNNDISRGGQSGIHTTGPGQLVEGNEIHHNNTEGFSFRWEAGGLKTAHASAVTVNNNHFHHNHGNAVWFDIDSKNNVISNNRIHDNARRGIHYELSFGGEIFGNVLWENGWETPERGNGAAIGISNSSVVEVYDNTAAWNADGIVVVGLDREGTTWDTVHDVHIHNNTVLGEDHAGDPRNNFALAWLQGWSNQMFDPTNNNRGASNRYWYPDPESNLARYEWRRAGYTKLADFNATPGEENGRYLAEDEKDAVVAGTGIPAAMANRSPEARAQATPTSGPAPLEVAFDGRGSIDPDLGDALTYAWDLDGDGAYDDSVSAQPSHTYDTPGDYAVGLKVADGREGTDTLDQSLRISAGEAPPVASIASPPATTKWRVGEAIPFLGSAKDPQDGALPESALSWSLALHHCPSINDCHEHSVQESPGVASGEFAAPDHGYPSHLELRLTATDSGGLTGTQTLRLEPETVQLSFRSDPAGLELVAGNEGGTAPFSRTVIVGSQNSITAPGPQTAGSVVYEFASWSDGGERSHDIIASAEPGTYTAYYEAVDTVPETTITDGPSGTVNVNSASFVFSSDEPNSQFQCSLDDGSYETCTSPEEYAGLTDGQHKFSVRAIDAANNVDASPAVRIWTVDTGTVDTAAPTIVDKLPPGGSKGVALDAKVEVFFSEEMDPSTVNNTTVRLVRADNSAVVAATVGYDASTKKATLIPSSGLEANTVYKATVRGGVKDLAGNMMGTAKSWQFTTGAGADTTPPTVDPPSESLLGGSKLGTSAVPVSLAWSATDETAIGGYQLQRSTDGGSYSNVSLPSATATALVQSLAPARSYAFRVRATDKAGNQSGWAQGTGFTLEAYQESNAAISYAGAWTNQNTSDAYGGALKYANGTKSGNKAAFSFAGNELAWVSARGPNRGRAEVWVDGTKETTVDLYSPTTQPRTVVFDRSWTSPGSHVIEVRVLQTKNAASSGKRVDVDSFVVIR